MAMLALVSTRIARETSMSEGAGKQEPPTYFANIVTLQVNADETVLEFRRSMTPQREQLKMQPFEEVVSIPPPTPEKVFEVDPVARVVLTFSAAEALRANLNNMLPREIQDVHASRRNRELHFRETKRDLLISLSGQWVCLEGEAIVSHGNNLKEVVEAARKRGVHVPYIFRVSDEPKNSVRIGL